MSLTTPNENEVTKKIENQTAKIPSVVFLGAAVAAMAVALALKCTKQKENALFVGQWAAPFLLFGIYNKLVKTVGND